MKEENEFEKVECACCGAILVEGIDTWRWDDEGLPICCECFEINSMNHHRRARK